MTVSCDHVLQKIGAAQVCDSYDVNDCIPSVEPQENYLVKKLSVLFRTLCPLVLAASCASEESPPDSPDGDYEGIEEASQGLTDLSGRCSFVSSSGTATIALATGDVAMVNKLASGALGINGYACSTATIATLKKLTVTGTAGDQTMILDFLGGTFGAGTTTGTGIDVDLGAGTGDALKIRGTKLADTYVFGSTGIATNGDAFKDISYAGVETFVVTMTDGADTFSGAGNTATGGAAFATAVTVYGGAGDDTLRGGGGDDTLNGGDGNDSFTTGATADGADTLVGGAGTDTADYSARTGAVDLSLNATGDDGAALEADNICSDIEILKGGDGADTLTGSAANDTIFGGPGNDTITGGLGNDILNGDAGNDTFLEGALTSGADTMNGGAGSDTVSYALRGIAVSVTLDGVATSGQSGELDKVMVDVENVTGGTVNDTITGSALDNVLDGGAGNDTISGGLGNDTLRGGVGNDTLNGDAGDDVFDEGAAISGNDTITGGIGVDKVDYSARIVALVVKMDGVTASGDTANSEADVIAIDVENLIGGGAADTLTGNALDNLIEGGPVASVAIDTIFGLAGDDTIDGGLGADVIDCGTGDADILLDTTAPTPVSCEL
jgi:Ca2+-binding RTX toxin-like protein